MTTIKGFKMKNGEVVSGDKSLILNAMKSFEFKAKGWKSEKFADKVEGKVLKTPKVEKPKVKKTEKVVSRKKSKFRFR